MQVQPGFDRDTAATQRVCLPPFEPGDRADLDAGAFPCGSCSALADRPAVTPSDDRVLDQAATPRKTRYASHPLLEIVLSRLVPVVRSSLSHAGSFHRLSSVDGRVNGANDAGGRQSTP